ncbi:DNA-directed DNA polymerase [Ferroglobus placidus DSM 10642]|uniref:DNA polymerase II small subunit n=1 Tax=Ferroglobus placidus (strain DSM 10642 / AEDII12DO) TaxID=589924 RepID=D3RXP4_FERPA|nr:DNA-directed DNA polymerase II small subunit [Ferroglobus placidus]ADC65257.1 DNA-directed DNA polymerase [Ferroglobus placidus DSM 10642]
MVIKTIDTKFLVKKFAVYGYNLHPSAVEELRNCSVSIDDLLKELQRICDGKFIITAEDIREAEKRARERYSKRLTVKKETAEKKEEKVCGELQILKDVTGRSTCRGDVEDFIAYFNSRYEKILRILRGRVNPVPVSSLWKLRSEKVDVVGIVNDVREVNENTAIIELEDKTGIVNVLASGKIKEEAMELVGDEVIGVSGTINGNRIIADRIIFPDVPINNGRKKRSFRMVFISDIHFGSKTFLKEEWERFVSWINCESGNEKLVELAEEVKYVFVAGDVVDGVGIYPEQEKELEIVDIYQQYETAAEYFDMIRKDVKIIVSPGNHDAVRQAEPQPALPKEFSSLFSNNVVCVGNPSMIDVSGVKVLMYHGRSLDDLISKINRLNYAKPQEALFELLKRRHLSPMYGERVPIAPEKEDYLVIDEVPDVLHSGHVHTYGTGFYRGIFVVCSSTWQSQTEFQKKVNLNPMPGIVAVYQPGGEVVRLRFYSE